MYKESRAKFLTFISEVELKNHFHFAYYYMADENKRYKSKIFSSRNRISIWF